MIHPSDSLAFIHRRGTTYTVPIDVMRPLAALLMRNPSTNIPAFVAALREIKGHEPARVIAELIAKDASK